MPTNTRKDLLEMLDRYNASWERHHARWLQHRLSEDHEGMTNDRIMIDRINLEMDAMDEPELLAAE